MTYLLRHAGADDSERYLLQDTNALVYQDV